MITANLVFAWIIAFGLVYNGARISLSERGYELATLRVLGFTQREAITECAARVQATPGESTECTFLGRTLTLPALST